MEKFMKKILSLFLTLILSLSVLPTLVACNDDSSQGPQGPTYSEYIFDESYHWRTLIDGEGEETIEYEAHYNPAGAKHGKCNKCDYYFPCHKLVYKKVTIDGVEGYEVYDYDEEMSPNFYHVEVPKFYQGDDDVQPLPVVSIGAYALSNRVGYGKCGVKLESIKLNEGLKSLGVGVFSASNIIECVIPNSVTTALSYTLFNCTLLKKVIVGNGVPKINSWTFYYSTSIEEVVIGNSVTEIENNNFYGKTQLKYVVLPASLVSLPEYVYESNGGQLGIRYETFVNCGSFKIFIDKTFDEVEDLTYQPTPIKDASIDTPRTTYGYVRGWNSSAPIYYKNEWHYDNDGTPVPN